MTNRKRVWACGLTACAVLVVLLSAALLISHAGHECTGKDCPICDVARAYGECLKVMSLTLAAGIGVAARLLPMRGVGFRRARAVPSGTLVSLKVKLSN